VDERCDNGLGVDDLKGACAAVKVGAEVLAGQKWTDAQQFWPHEVGQKVKLGGMEVRVDVETLAGCTHHL
jgi:hypothetical protein